MTDTLYIDTESKQVFTSSRMWATMLNPAGVPTGPRLEVKGVSNIEITMAPDFTHRYEYGSAYMDSLLTAGMGYGRRNRSRFHKRSKELVWSSKRRYWHVVDPDPVVLPFGLWEQAETKHKDDKLIVL